MAETTEPRPKIARARKAMMASAVDQTVAMTTEAVRGTAAVTDPAPASSPEFMEAAPSPAAESDVTASVAETMAAMMEGSEQMATMAPTSPTEATDKAQAMLGDMSGRFKSAVEKSTKMSEEMADFAKGNVEAVIASARVAATGGQAIGQDVADYSKKSFESATAAFKSFASVKSPTELFQLQSDYAKSSFDSMVAEASKFSETMMKLAGEVVQPLSNRYALAAEKFKAPIA